MNSKLNMHSLNKVDKNIEMIGAMFPNCLTETKNEKTGEIERAIDFDILRQELSGVVVEGPQERYQFTWPDKRQSILLANSPIAKTLRPCREESVNYDTTENLYIEGDNLDVLKLLQETYLGKIDVIYIDPPYNTGTSLIYKNDFTQDVNGFNLLDGQYDDENNRLMQNTDSNGRFHTDWLNMIYPRLKIARDLLKETGIIVLTIDDYEINTLTSIMNEVFSEQNHLGTVVIKNNPSGRSTVKGFSINHEYALFYSKSNSATLGRVKHNEAQRSRYKEQDKNGYFEWENFRKNGTDSDRSDRPKQFYPIVYNELTKVMRIPKVIWNDSIKEYSLSEDISSNEKILYPITSLGNEKVWKYGIERTSSILNEILVKNTVQGYELYRKKYINEQGSLPRTWWDKPDYSARDNGTRTLTNVFGPVKLFDFPKAPEAVKDALITANLPSDGFVLDFFSGSATTAHAVMQLNAEDDGNRKFIMVQLPEQTDEKSEAYKAGYKNICEIGKERIRRAGNLILNSECLMLNGKAKKDNSELSIKNYALDVGFRVLKLDSTNMKDVYYNPQDIDAGTITGLVDNIKEDRKEEDLLYQVMLELGVLLSSTIEQTELAGKKVFRVNDNYLIACFDENVTEETVTEIAKQKPYYFVMRDSSMANDSVATNFEQIFETYSKDTIRKVL